MKDTRSITRYNLIQRYIGEYAKHPLTDESIPIIGDEMIDVSFGSGVVKISPFHCKEDYLCAKRHNLPMKKNDILANRFERKIEAERALRKNGLYAGREENHKMNLSVCGRSGDLLETVLIPQWYVKCSGFKDLLHGLEIAPPSFKPVFDDWIGNTLHWKSHRQNGRLVHFETTVLGS
jgi:valyl-tRNA synthetase